MNKFNFFLPRAVRESLGNRKQELLRLMNDDNSKKKYLKSYFVSTKSIFIHIPKCAGTSVAKALYGKDPWHHSIKEYENICCLDDYVKFAVVRDPVERFVSTYDYLIRKSEQYPKSIYTDALESNSINKFFEDFVEGKNDVEINYFLRSQAYYVCKKDGEIGVDVLINMSDLDNNFSPLRDHFNYHDKFPKENSVRTARTDINDELHEKIKNHYSADYALL